MKLWWSISPNSTEKELMAISAGMKAGWLFMKLWSSIESVSTLGVHEIMQNFAVLPNEIKLQNKSYNLN